MTKGADCYGLKPIAGSSDAHAIVIVHGIRQVREDLEEPFGRYLADFADPAKVYVYGYNHTRGLVENGRKLADALSRGISAERVDIVGYSMGGLVARLAATDRPNAAIRTIVTLATPNRGALSNAQLGTLGQFGRKAFELFSPLAVGTEGVKDLTRAGDIMYERYQQVLRRQDDGAAVLALKRYASVPGLYYNPDRAEFSFGPSLKMSGVQAFLLLLNLKARLTDMQKPHDGIVTEASNNLTDSASYQWSEVDIAVPGAGGEPALCHAVVDRCRDHDHLSILTDQTVARLVWNIVDCADWRALVMHDPQLRYRVRATTKP